MSLVNANQLSRVLGVSHTAIAKAVKTGRISIAGQDDKGRNQYDTETALAEWGANTNPSKTREKRTGGRPRKDGTPAQPRVTPTTSPHHPSRPGPNGGGEGRTTYNESAALEKHYQAQLARLEYEQKIGALVPIVNVAQEVEKEYARVRARLLAIPSKLAPDVALIDDAAQCRLLIEAAITDALNELAADAAANEAASDDSD
ncbi:MAG: hypothetical protein AB7U34_01115 [Novosphingobium sp.]